MKKRTTKALLLTAILAIMVCLGTGGSAYALSGPGNGTDDKEVLRITKKLGPGEGGNQVKPEETYWDTDGNKYGLEGYEVKEVPGSMISVNMEKQIVYQGVEGAEGIPETISVQEESSGESAQGTLSIRDARILGEEWKEGFEAPVIFHAYGSDGYEAGPVVIGGGDELQEALAAREEILGMMGLIPEEYRISTMEWAGEPYEDQEGQVCRQAMARGEKLVRDYEVTYAGEVAYMEPATYEMEMVYRPIPPLPIQDVREQPDIVPAGTGVPSEAEHSLLWHWVRNGFVITVGAGLVGVGVGIILLAAAWLKERKREREQHRLPRFPD